MMLCYLLSPRFLTQPNFDNVENDLAVYLETVMPAMVPVTDSTQGVSDPLAPSGDIPVITQDNDIPQLNEPKLSLEETDLINDTFGSLCDADGNPLRLTTLSVTVLTGVHFNWSSFGPTVQPLGHPFPL